MLGYYVARVLMGWGVRDLSLVDSGTVAFSNPALQSLFKFANCLEYGKSKAEYAAEALKRILPSVKAKGVQLSMPMPGHLVPPGNVETVREEVGRLEKLAEETNAVFL